MAWVLTITYGGTTLTLTDNSAYRLKLFNPASNGEAERTAQTAEIEVLGVNQAAVAANIRALNLAFWQARHFEKEKTGNRVYLNYTPHGYADALRSEVFNGEALLDGESQGWQWTHYNRVKMILALERSNYWEGALTQLPLTNGNGTDDLTGLNVYGGNDGAGSSPNKRHNYFYCKSASIAGDLPGPAVFRITGQGAPYWTKRAILAQNVFSTPASLAHMIEVEAFSGDLTDAADAGASGGNYSAIAIPASGDFTATITYDCPLTYLNGSLVHIVGCMLASQIAPVGTYARVGLYIPSIAQTFWTGWKALSASQYVLDLGALRMPPMTELSAPANATLTIDLKNLAGGTVNMDYVLLMVSDGYRHYPTLAAAAGGVLNDDGVLDLVYAGSATTSPLPQPEGDPFKIVPGYNNYFYWAHENHEQDGGTEYNGLGNYDIFKLYYRPRWRTI
jgi:hypothetical protein